MKNKILVKIGNSLDVTRKKYGCNNNMKLMKNRVFKAKHIHDNRVIIYYEDSGYDYTFAIDDVTIVKIPPIITKPVIFNPDELDI